MKKIIKSILILIVGTLLFLISYSIDGQVSLFFKSARLRILDITFSLITNFSVLVLIMLVIPSVIIYKKNKKLTYLLWLIFFVSFISSFIIKLVVLRQRPIEVFTYPFTNIINYSFPSMHSMVAFSLLPVLVNYFRKQKYFWIVFALSVAVSRIYFEFHYLSDVVFGALLGYFIGKHLFWLYEERKLFR